MSDKLRSILSCLLLLAVTHVAPTAFAQAPVAQGTPDAMVRDLTTQVLDAIRADSAIAAGDVNRIQKLIDEKILPYVDSTKMTRLAVGRGWRDATAEQRTALTQEFRMLLLRTYSGALAQVKDHQVQMRPSRAQASDTDVLVRSAVVPARGDPIQLDYRLEKQDTGWKIYDVNVLGVWLVETYRTQFASEISAGGVDGLIKSLTERNKALAENKKA